MGCTFFRKCEATGFSALNKRGHNATNARKANVVRVHRVMSELTTRALSTCFVLLNITGFAYNLTAHDAPGLLRPPDKSHLHDIETTFCIGACQPGRTSEVRRFGASMFSVTGSGNPGKGKNHSGSRILVRAKCADVSCDPVTRSRQLIFFARIPPSPTESTANFSASLKRNSHCTSVVFAKKRVGDSAYIRKVAPL